MRLSSIILAALCLVAGTARGEEGGWQRIVCIDEARITVTLLIKSPATPADEEFIGFELLNKTDKPLLIKDTPYRLADIRCYGLSDEKLISTTSNLASGNSYDLLWREGQRRPDPPRQQDSIPPGVTRRLRYASAYALGILRVPREQGLRVEGLAHFEVDLSAFGAASDPLTTPKKGVPFRFDWPVPDAAALTALRARLVRMLAQPSDSFADTYVLGTLLYDPRIAPAASVEEMLAGLKRHDTVVRPTIVRYLDQNHPTDPRVIDFFLREAVAAGDRELLSELSAAAHIRDVRLIDPLVQRVRDDAAPFHVSHFALMILTRHRDLTPDRKATAAELGRITLKRTRYVSTGELPDDEPWRWASEVRDLVLTGDASLVRSLVPYLDRKEVVLDASQTSAANNGVSDRACDMAYNGILDLLGRPGERFSMSDWSERPAPGKEYARRDVLIAKLKVELSRHADQVWGAARFVTKARSAENGKI